MEPNTLTPTRLLTIPEAAERLALSARMVEELISDGEMSPVRIRRSVRVTDTEIEEFIERKRHNDDGAALNGPVVDGLENGTVALTDRVREFNKRLPSELAKLRRAVHQAYPQVDMHPVSVNGSTARGLKAGYFQTRLRDGSLGYPQRRTDDCLQAAVASCLQIPPHQVPDLHMEQLVAAGKDPEEMERASWKKMNRWLGKHGVTVRYHAVPPTAERRWIGVVTEADMFSDHCLLMSRRDCLFDVANILPSLTSNTFGAADVDYGIVFTDR